MVDERLAAKADGSGLLGCSPSDDGELWPCYLEKAVACHCGGWDKIDGKKPRFHTSSSRTAISCSRKLVSPMMIIIHLLFNPCRRWSVYSCLVSTHGMQIPVHDPKRGQRSNFVRVLWQVQPEQEAVGGCGELAAQGVPGPVAHGVA